MKEVRPLRVLLLAAIAISALSLVFGPSSVATVEAGGSSLANEIAKQVRDHKLGNKVKVGVYILNLDTGNRVYSNTGTTPLVPASNQKLLTTAAALCELGSDFKHRTDFRYRGSIDGETLNGDLLLIGRGDPNISGRLHDGDELFVMKRFASSLKEKGVTKVSGRLYFDESYFSGERSHESWPNDQYLRWYCAEVSALSFNDNCIGVKVDPRRSGSNASVTTVPATGYVSLTGNVDTIGGKSDPKVGWTRQREDNTLKVWGKVASGRPAYQGECTVHDPADYTAHVLLETLKRYGISVVGGKARGKAPSLKGWNLIEQHTSDLPVSLTVCNQDSQNLYAECLYRIIGKEKADEGSFSGGAKAVKAFLKDAKVFSDGVEIADGSGLARVNKVSTRTVAELLQYMHKHDDAALYRASLAVAGRSGTLRRRLRGNDTKGKVFAKTGTIRGVSSLSGYVTSKSGTEYAFSIIVNDHRGWSRGLIDGIVESIAEH